MPSRNLDYEMESTKRIYFDHAATTPLDPRVLEAMVPVYAAQWGNASSSYFEGREARKTLEQARRSTRWGSAGRGSARTGCAPPTRAGSAT